MELFIMRKKIARIESKQYIYWKENYDRYKQNSENLFKDLEFSKEVCLMCYRKMKLFKRGGLDLYDK